MIMVPLLPDSLGGRLRWLLVFGLVALSLMACRSTPDPQVQSLEPTAQAADARLQSIDASQRSIDHSLARLESLTSDFDALRDATSDTDLPLSLLRLVAINCLNHPYRSVDQERHLLNGRPLTCQPEHLSRLDDLLQDASTSERDRAHDLLLTVDQARLLHGSTRQRIRRLRLAADDHMAFIADERARLRRHEETLQTQQHRFSEQGWQRANDDLQQRHQQLNDIQSLLAEVADHAPQWQERLNASISALYVSISNLAA